MVTALVACDGNVTPEQVKELLAAHGLTLAVPEFKKLGLSHRPREIILRHNIHTLKQLTFFTEAELLNMVNFGEQCLAEVKELLAAHGMSLRGSPK